MSSLIFLAPIKRQACRQQLPTRERLCTETGVCGWGMWFHGKGEMAFFVIRGLLFDGLHGDNEWLRDKLFFHFHRRRPRGSFCGI